MIIKTFLRFIRENAGSTELMADIKSAYSRFKTKDLSARRFNLYVPAKDRMKIAEKIAKDFNGTLAKDGAVAGKPVVDLDYGLRVFVKPIPGSGVGGTAKEDAQLLSLQKQIEAALSNENVVEITIRIGNKVYNVAGAATTPGTPKSDFHLLNANGQEVVWVSHKDGTGPRGFQQWSGITKRSEPEIHNHNETQQFIKDVKDQTDNVMPRATTLSRKINDTRLMNLSVYGNQYGKSLGRQNVTILLQGPVKLVKTKSVYELRSNHTLINGEPVKGGYEPVFMAMYKGDRSNFGVKGARFAIQPKDSRKSKEI